MSLYPDYKSIRDSTIELQRVTNEIFSLINPINAYYLFMFSTIRPPWLHIYLTLSVHTASSRVGGLLCGESITHWYHSLEQWDVSEPTIRQHGGSNRANKHIHFSWEVKDTAGDKHGMSSETWGGWHCNWWTAEQTYMFTSVFLSKEPSWK